MYLWEQKDAIMQKIENGVSTSEASAETGIPEATIKEWIIKKEIKAIIDELMDNGKFDEAKKKAEELTQGTSETIKLSIFSRIAKKEGNRAREKELLEKRLQLEPDNVKVMSSLARIAREENNFKREKKLIEEILRIEPNNIIGRKLLKWYTNRAKKISNRRNGKKCNKQSKGSKKNSGRLDKEQKREIEAIMLSQEQVKETPISLARKMIYESQDIASASERIKELIEGENEADRQLVIAELYYHTGLIDRAEKSLKAYKRTFGENAKGDEVRAVNKALEIIRMKKPRGFEWQDFWNTRLNVAQTEQSSRENKKPSDNALDEEER